MTSNLNFRFKPICWVFLTTWLCLACSSSKNSNPKYEAAWQQLVDSEQWEASLDAAQEGRFGVDNQEYKGEEVTDAIVDESTDPFEDQYESWVSRAYFKIITEAEEADHRIKAEHDRFLAENPEADTSTDENVQRIMERYKRRYQAHQSMLEGLKSWHAFDAYGSDDLKFFKEENREVVRGMYLRGRPDEKIVDFLVYKLADLYHFESQ